MKHRRYLRLAFTFLLMLILLTFPLPGGMKGHVSASTAMAFTTISVPAPGAGGGWVLAPGSDISMVATSGSGRMFAAVNGLSESLFISDDSGLTWRPSGDIHQEIIDIAVPIGNPNTVLITTSSRVYQSSDAGKTFFPLPSAPGSAGTGNRVITSVDVTLADGYIVTVGVRDEDTGEYGGVFLFDERELVPVWQDTGLTEFDVLDVAFSPGYSTDQSLIAAVSDETETAIFYYRAAGWNAPAGTAHLRSSDDPATPIAAEAACLAFPDEFLFDPSSADAAFYAGISTGSETGDVYRIDYRDDTLNATDLDTGLERGLTNADISCLAVSGLSPAVKLLAGRAAGTTIFLSEDGGSTWKANVKEPAGTAVTAVSFDQSQDGYFAATRGSGSGAAVSRDGRVWNQVSLIDTDFSAIVDLAPSPNYASDATLFLLTWGAGHSLWRSNNGGTRWERVLWPGIAGATAFHMVALPPDFGGGSDTVFCAGEINGTPGILVSSDGGQTFRSRSAIDPETSLPFTIDAWAVINDTTLLAAGYDGNRSMVYRTDNAGFFFAPGIPAGDLPITSLTVSPDFRNDGSMLAGTAAGDVYLYDDTERFRSITNKDGQTPFTGTVYPIFDTDYSENSYIYAAGAISDEGIYRFRTSTGTDWENIDDTLPNGSQLERIILSSDGILYAVNMDTGGGIERCLVPDTLMPEFDTMTRGLDDGVTLYGLWTSGNHIWTTNGSASLLRCDDALTAPVTTVSPPDTSGGCGSLIDHAVRNITLDWETLPGATGYQWQCSDNNNFTDIPSGLEGTTEASSVRLPSLEPGVAYYWRVRASSPVFSPWSNGMRFSTSLDTEETALKPVSPAAGAIDIPVLPLFQWTAIQSATAYDLLIAQDVDFTALTVARTGENGLSGNVWQCDIPLETGTTYYWKVRGCTPDTQSPWSATGIFTTLPGPETNQNPEGTIAVITPASPAAPSTTVAVMPPVITQPAQTVLAPSISLDIPAWFLYGAGGLLGLIFLTLLVILAAILKVRSG